MSDVGHGVGEGVLVERARHGDSAAFGVLYRSNVAGVGAVVRAHIANPAVVDDVVQETFVRALEGLDGLADVRRFRPWLFGIARHVAMDHHRQQAKVELTDSDVPDDSAESAIGPEVVAELAELAVLVRQCVTGLSRRDAIAIDLVTYLGFTPAQVGAALGISTGAAKVTVHRARRRLRDALVLELMVRRRGSGCQDLEALLVHDSVLAASRHVRDCATCGQLAMEEVIPYDSRSTIRMPDRFTASESASGSLNGSAISSPVKPLTSAPE